MNKKPVIFIDSGIGGLSTLATALSFLNFDSIYFADTHFAPYGTKTKKWLQTRLKDIVFKLSETIKPHCIVLACNTATTNTISNLRRCFPGIHFIGTEPALTLAKKLGFKHPILIATPQTIKSIKTHSANFVSLPNLATNIETYITSRSYLSLYNILKDIFYIKTISKPCDCLILGCTHYVLIKDLISKYISIPIIDGNEGVSKQIALIVNNKTIQQNLTIPTIKFVFSSKDSIKHEKYKKILKQILAKPIKLC